MELFKDLAYMAKMLVAESDLIREGPKLVNILYMIYNGKANLEADQEEVGLNSLFLLFR